MASGVSIFCAVPDPIPKSWQLVSPINESSTADFEKYLRKVKKEYFVLKCGDNRVLELPI